MEVLTLLLVFLTVSGYSYVLQPIPQISELEGEPPSEMRSEQLRDVSISAKETRKSAEFTDGRKMEEKKRSEGLTPETNSDKKTEQKITAQNIKTGYKKESQGGLTRGTFSKNLREKTKREEFPVSDMVKDFDTNKGDDVERREALETNEESETVKETLTDSTKTLEAVKTFIPNTWVQQKGGGEETLNKFNKMDQMDKLRQEMEEEEKESKLVGGISRQEETGGDDLEEGEKMSTGNQENAKEKRGNEEREKREEEGEDIKHANHNQTVRREKEDHIVGNLTPPLSTSSTQLGEITASTKTITQSQNPQSLSPHHHHQVPPSVLVTPTHVPSVSLHPPKPNAKVSPHAFPPSVTAPNPPTTNHISVSTVAPGEVRSVILLEDLLAEVSQSSGHHLKHNEQEGKASPNLEDTVVKNILIKPARKDQQTTRESPVSPKETEFIREVQTPSPKPPMVKLIAKDLRAKEANSAWRSNENNPTVKPVEFTPKPNMNQPTGKPKMVKLTENYTKLTKKQNKASPQPQLKPSVQPQLTTAKTSSMRPAKINRSSKNKTIEKSKEKKRKKDNKTQKLTEKEEDISPMHFPYFLDNYCPPECACYGRVVQCSDKGVDKVPYGIPYNARYILLMNNHINIIQLDLLNEYVSMEFLVLSNNLLTDGAIEGAFDGIPALKRLYLDRNLLESVPTDLPISLEELRLDNNQLSMMSKAAWAQCPSLLVLSLSNNSLGNGSDPLPDAVLSPLSNLRTLNLDYNQLTLVPLSLPLSIKELYLKGNLIEQFRGGAFNGMSELAVLDLSANRLTNKGLLRDSFLNVTHLESLNLEGNRLKQVPRHLPPSLKTLNLEGNLISSIKKAALRFLKNLEHLGLARNKIVKVAPGAFKALPVLHQLDLCHNTLHQVPRQLPQALHSVALTHNKIQSVPRDAFCWGDKSLSLSRLVRVQLENNLIDMGKLDAQAFRCLRGFQVVHFY